MEALIVTENLSKTYLLGGQQLMAIKNINLTISANEYVALTGPSGSGKSTLMNLLGALDSPSSGTYWLNGKDVSRLHDPELAAVRNKQIGFIFQTFNLIPRFTAVENVALPLLYANIGHDERIRLATEKLREVGLSQRLHHKPNELSGGQRQRVAIARALVNQPSLLLADEPTGNLDSKTTDDIMDLFENLHKGGNTIVVVTHEPDIAQRAQRVVRLTDGRIESDIMN
jgi:putative ABC transport system ATP-binding protein